RSFAESRIKTGPLIASSNEASSGPVLILLSAKDLAGLRRRAAALANFLERRASENGSVPDLRDVAFTLQVGREACEERVSFTTENVLTLVDQLRRIADGTADPGVARGNWRNDDSPAGRLLRGEMGERLASQASESRDWDSLAQLWAAGVEVDWAPLH